MGTVSSPKYSGQPLSMASFACQAPGEAGDGKGDSWQLSEHSRESTTRYLCQKAHAAREALLIRHHQRWVQLVTGGLSRQLGSGPGWGWKL